MSENTESKDRFKPPRFIDMDEDLMADVFLQAAAAADLKEKDPSVEPFLIMSPPSGGHDDEELNESRVVVFETSISSAPFIGI